MYKLTTWVLLLLLPLAAPSRQAHAEDGVTKDTILIGRSAGLTGPNIARSKPVTDAVNAYFETINEAGGVHGRRLKLINLDDGNELKRAVENTRKLVAEEKVFTMFLASAGPTTLAVLPVIAEYQVPLIGSTSGSETLRKPNRLLFHTKASYTLEFAKMTAHMKTTGVERVAVVFSDDGSGREAEQLAIAALQKEGLKMVADIGFKPGGAKAAVEQLARANAQAVILGAISGPGAEFYKEFVKLPVRPQVFAWSVTGVEAIYKEVGEKAHGLVVAQVSHAPTDRSVGVVREYQALLKKAGLADGGYPGMEGYIAARVLVEGLRRAGKEPTRDKLIAALEAMRDYDLGGDMVSFGPDHVGRRYVDLTILGRDGRFLH